MPSLIAQKKLDEGQKFFHSEPPNFERAASLFHEVTQFEPAWAEGYFCHALALLEQSRFADAEPQFRRAIALDRNDRGVLVPGCRMSRERRAWRAGCAAVERNEVYWRLSAPPLQRIVADNSFVGRLKKWAGQDVAWQISNRETMKS